MRSVRKPTSKSALVLGSLCCLLTAGPLTAQPTAQQQSTLRNNCRSDFMSHCAGVQPGGAEAPQCLQRNAAKLSPGCQSAVNALGAPSARQPQPAAASTSSSSRSGATDGSRVRWR